MVLRRFRLRSKVVDLPALKSSLQPHGELHVPHAKVEAFDCTVC